MPDQAHGNCGHGALELEGMQQVAILLFPWHRAGVGPATLAASFAIPRKIHVVETQLNGIHESPAENISAAWT